MRQKAETVGSVSEKRLSPKKPEVETKKQETLQSEFANTDFSFELPVIPEKATPKSEEKVDIARKETRSAASASDSETFNFSLVEDIDNKHSSAASKIDPEDKIKKKTAADSACFSIELADDEAQPEKETSSGGFSLALEDDSNTSKNLEKEKPSVVSAPIAMAAVSGKTVEQKESVAPSDNRLNLAAASNTMSDTGFDNSDFPSDTPMKAIIWRLIATAFHAEVGYVAWAIGGLIGFSAGMAGGRGQKIGIICALLAIFAILGGKYMAYNALITDAMTQAKDSVIQEKEGFREFYNSINTIASDYEPEMSDKAFLRLLHEHGNSIFNSSEIEDYDISEVRAYLETQLESVEGKNFDQWFNSNIAANIETSDLPSFLDIFMESFDWRDLIFLVLGVVTAFKVAERGGDFNEIR